MISISQTELFHNLEDASNIDFHFFIKSTVKNYQKVDMHISSICKTAYIVLLLKIVVFNDSFPTFILSISRIFLPYSSFSYCCQSIWTFALQSVNYYFVGSWCNKPQITQCKVYIWSRILYTKVRLACQ